MFDGRFYEAFASRRDKASVGECLEEYVPPISPEHHTCVGLGLTLISKLYQSDLCDKFPGLREGLHIVSCEEAVDDPQLYVQDRPQQDTVEKEHVLVALRLDINGRQGMLLLDPGYHVARVVTVMADEKYPHTGWSLAPISPTSHQRNVHFFNQLPPSDAVRKQKTKIFLRIFSVA